MDYSCQTPQGAAPPGRMGVVPVDILCVLVDILCGSADIQWTSRCPAPSACWWAALEVCLSKEGECALGYPLQASGYPLFSMDAN